LRAAGVEGAELERVQHGAAVGGLAPVAGLDAVADNPGHQLLLGGLLRLGVDAAGEPEYVVAHGLRRERRGGGQFDASDRGGLLGERSPVHRVERRREGEEYERKQRRQASDQLLPKVVHARRTRLVIQTWRPSASALRPSTLPWCQDLANLGRSGPAAIKPG